MIRIAVIQMSRLAQGTAARKIEVKIDIETMFGYMFFGALFLMAITFASLIAITWIPIGR